MKIRLGFLERIIVKRDVQAMKMIYDNNDVVPSSEAKRTFDSAQDWTKYGIKSVLLSPNDSIQHSFY